MIIRIKELQAQTILGIYDWEKKAKRPVVLNIELQLSDEKAATSDEMEDSVDYDLIERSILQRLNDSSYNLIEKLSADIAQLVLSLDKRIARVTVETDKPGALKHAKSVSVTAAVSCS